MKNDTRPYGKRFAPSYELTLAGRIVLEAADKVRADRTRSVTHANAAWTFADTTPTKKCNATDCEWPAGCGSCTHATA